MGMSRQTRMLAATAALLVGLGGAGGAGVAAADVREDKWPTPADAALVGDANHLVHYSAGGVGQATAQAALAALANARARFVALGFRPPPTDEGRGGDDRYDLYLCTSGTTCFGRTQRGGAPAETDPKQPNGPATGYSFLFLADYARPENIVAHEYFHTWQHGYLAAFGVRGAWWGEMTAEWAASEVAPGPLSAVVGDNVICTGASGQGPLDDACITGSYAAYPFVSYLAARWGPAFVPDVFAEQVRLGEADPGVGHARAALENTLVGRGSSLPAEFALFARASLLGGFGIFPPGKPVFGHQSPFIDAGAPPMTLGAWGVRFRSVQNFTQQPVGVSLQGLDPALDGAASGGQQLPIPPSGAMRVLIPAAGRLDLSFTSPSDAARTAAPVIVRDPAPVVGRRAPVMTMRPGPRPRRRNATALRVACPATGTACRSRFVLAFRTGPRKIKRDGPTVALAPGKARVVTIPLGSRLARSLRGRRRAKLLVSQIPAVPGAFYDTFPQKVLTLSLGPRARATRRSSR